MAFIAVFTFGPQVPLYAYDCDVAPSKGDGVLIKDKLYVVREVIHEPRVPAINVYVDER